MTVLRYMTDYVTDPHRHDGRHDSLARNPARGGVQPQAVGGKHKTNFGGPEKLIFKTTVQTWLAIVHWQSALLQAWVRGFDPCPEREFFVFVSVLLSKLIAHLKPVVCFLNPSRLSIPFQ